MADDGRWSMVSGQRSMINWGLIGHEWAVQMLKQQLAHDSLRHAYLFSGPPGLGRRTLALRLAQAVNCPQPPAPGEFCGLCKTCQQIERMQYADMTVIQAEKEGGILKVEQIRSIRQSLVLKPYQGRYRVALFLRFQEANANAANALLKTLEEAPPHALLLLTADTPESLLPTITSRCEILRLRPLPVGTVETSLEQRGVDAATAHLLAHVSSGRPGYAMRLAQDRDLLAFRTKRLDDLLALLQSTRRGRFAFAEKLTDRKTEAREHPRETLLIWLSFWRDVLLGVSGADAPLVNVDRQAQVAALAGRLALADAHQLVASAEEAIGRLERNVNPRLLVEVLLLDWPHE
jgi:DNA polymerase III subunit delta'